MLNDSTCAGIGKVDVAGNDCPENYAEAWSSYFETCEKKDLMAAFDALVKLGMRPVPVGADDNGKIKKPIGGTGWGLKPNSAQRTVLENRIADGEPIGLGVQPDGYLVIDLDCKDKDRSRIGKFWEEAGKLLFEEGRWPETFAVKTEGGAHVWLRLTGELASVMREIGKFKHHMPDGDCLEFFSGTHDKQIQVACPPSAGKTISAKFYPVPVPASLADFLLNNTKKKAIKPPPQKHLSKPIVIKPIECDKQGNRDRLNAYVMPILSDIANAPNGTKHDTLFKKAAKISNLVAGTGFEGESSQYKEQILNSLAANPGTVASWEGAIKTIDDGWAKGAETPDYRLLEGTDDRLPVEFGGPLEGTRPASVEDIEAQILARKWVWGDAEKNTGWIVERGLHLVEGKEGTGKTRWIMDLVRRWTNGLPWPDGSPPSMAKDRKILFVAADQHWDQITMTCKEFGIPANQVLFAGPVEDPYGCISLDDRNTLEYVKRWCEELPIGMVVIDTLMVATSKPLADPQEVAQVAGPLRTLARETGIPVIMVGHLNAQGETWGRSVGRQCDHVIRMEADPKNEQTILIKSVKARWNKFELPVMYGQQGDSGWEYTASGSDLGEATQEKNKAAAMGLIVAYIESEGEKAWTEIRDEMSERGFKDSTIDRALKTLVADGRLVKDQRKFPSGKTCTFYDLDGYGLAPEEEPPF